MRKRGMRNGQGEISFSVLPGVGCDLAQNDVAH